MPPQPKVEDQILEVLKEILAELSEHREILQQLMEEITKIEEKNERGRQV